MPKITVMRGLPGSGKSTKAKEWVAEDPARRVRISRDDLRAMLFGANYDHNADSEALVTKLEEQAVRAALASDREPIVDAMHLKRKYVTRFERIAPVEVIDCTVPVSECVFNDGERGLNGGREVGELIIRDIAKRFHIPENGTLPKLQLDPERHVMSGRRGSSIAWRPAPEWDPELPNAYIFDVDGTLADLRHRSPYAKDAAEYAKDGVFEDVARLVNHLANTAYIIVVSGRSEEFRETTENWLFGKARISPDKLYMRSLEHARRQTPDDVVKDEIFENHIAGRYNVIGVIDDRGRVLRMWRGKGLTTFAVGDTDNNDF